MADGSLELNIVSDPAPFGKPSSRRSKKRGSGKAWDKKSKQNKKRGQQQSPRNINQQGSRGSEDKTPRPAIDSFTPSPNSSIREWGKRSEAAPPVGGSGGKPSFAATAAGSAGLQNGGRENSMVGNKDVPRHQSAAGTSVAAAGTTANNTNTATAGADATSSARRAEKSLVSAVHPHSGDAAAAVDISSTPNRTKQRGTEIGSNSKPKEPSNERRRVLEMAGRSTTTPKAAASGEGQKSGSKRGLSTSPSLSSSARATKRKRPATAGGSSEPVSSDGVVDFTGGDATPNKKVDPNRPDKNRRALATAAAVAKATEAMAKAGSKWWDDDDDGHVVSVAARAKTVTHTASASAYPGNPGWNNYEYGAATEGGGGEEIEEDKDGGLPSDVHPNSVRTKAVDMDGEASKALGILAGLLEKGGGSFGREESRRIKNGGKSKKKAKDVTLEQPPVEGDGIATTLSEPRHAETVPAVAHAMDVEGGAPDNAEAVDEADSKVHSTWKDETSTRQATSGGGGGDIGFASRKNRGRVSAASENANGGGGGVPLPEYHARPRELSRQAAAKPLASSKSTHVMAAGPGATFAALNMPQKMVSHLEEPKGDLGGGGMGLGGPTVCQLAAVPVLAAGHNTVIKSETGSGKTLAYLLPMLCDLAAMQPKVDREKGTLAIVLAPTRELSAQILDVLTRVVRPFIWLVPGSISGGERRKSEKARLRKGVTVLVCTPGRLLDHLKATKCFRRDCLKWLILDEADRLLDMGFEKQVKEIVELLDQSARAVRSGPAGGSRVQGGTVIPSVKVIQRQTVMVSATLDKGVSRMAATLLSKHMRVDVDGNFVESVDESGKAKLISGDPASSKKRGDKEKQRLEGGRNDVHSTDRSAAGSGAGGGSTDKFSTPRQLVQYYMSVTQKLRLPALCSFLRARAREKVVVFMSTCDAVDFHHELFRRAAWPGDGGSGVDDKNDEKQVAAKKKVAAADSEFFGVGCLVRRLHGNVPQVERQATYRAFGAAKSGVLICTDVAARGLDLPTVDWIVQYDPPAETADYVHRVGRTARKGERGHSLLFLLPREADYLGVLEARGLRPKPLSLEGVLCAADAGKRDARRADEQLAYELQQGLQLLVAGDKPLLDRARSAFQSHVRAYAARAPDSRAVFQVRSLHLGHVARSFALKDPPTAVKVGKRVVRRPGDSSKGRGGDGGGSGAGQGEKRRRDGAGGAGGSVHRLGLSKQTQMASRAEFL